jgi:DNA-binding PadR family transcriptional regulator
MRLTPTSYIVLGFVKQAGEATPYQLKQLVAGGIGNFWSVPHAQIYNEPERLARGGLLDEKVETTGRRRKRYRMTKEGEKALEAWLREPTSEFTELRDPGLLQLFLGAELAPLAEVQLDAHAARLAEYEGIRDQAGDDLPPRLRLLLDSGIGHEREWVRFWNEVQAAKDV